jgi:metallo-beta-lactamase class B
MKPRARRILLASAVAAATILPAVVRAQSAPGPAKLESLSIPDTAKALKWNEPVEPTKFVGPIHFVGTRGLGVYLITTSEGHLLLNSGMPPSGPMIEASIRKLGFNPRDVKILLANHAHIDHVGGHAYLQKLTGAKVAMMEQEVPLLESGAKTDFHYGTNPDFAFDGVRVDRVLHDGDTIKLGEVTLTAILTPGHTRGSTTFTTSVTDGGKSYAVAFPNGASINPGYRVVRDPSYPGIAADYRRTLDVFDRLKPDIWLMPHNDVFDLAGKRVRAEREGVKAWVDPEGYRKWASGQRERFDAVVKREADAAATPPNIELLRPKPGGAK